VTIGARLSSIQARDLRYLGNGAQVGAAIGIAVNAVNFGTGAEVTLPGALGAKVTLPGALGAIEKNPDLLFRGKGFTGASVLSSKIPMGAMVPGLTKRPAALGPTVLIAKLFGAKVFRITSPLGGFLIALFESGDLRGDFVSLIIMCLEPR